MFSVSYLFPVTTEFCNDMKITDERTLNTARNQGDQHIEVSVSLWTLVWNWSWKDKHSAGMGSSKGKYLLAILHVWLFDL